jgi:hypothetical protein
VRSPLLCSSSTSSGRWNPRSSTGKWSIKIHPNYFFFFPAITYSIASTIAILISLPYQRHVGNGTENRRLEDGLPYPCAHSFASSPPATAVQPLPLTTSVFSCDQIRLRTIHPR